MPQWDPVTLNELPSRELTTLHFLRHGAVDTGGQRLAYGHTDLPLSPQGVRQGRAMRDFAAGLEGIAGVISSDLRRCTETSVPLAEELGLPLICAAELREQHMGDWEGRPWSDLSAQHSAGVHAYWNDYLNARPPGGESWGDAAARIQRWFADQQPVLRGRDWIWVGHIGTLRSLLCEAFDVPLDQALRFTPARASYSQLLLAEAGPVLQILGASVGPRSAGPAARRIALSGSAGVGKTTLGRALAEQLDLPYLPEGMRRRLEGGLDVHTLGRDGHIALMHELWEEQKAQEAEALARHGGFVADRSSVDFAAFWLYFHFPDDPVIDSALAHAERYDAVITLPWGVLPLIDDGVRTPLPQLQRHFQGLVEGLGQRHLRADQRLLLPDLRVLDERVAWCLGALGQRSGLV